MKWEETRTSFEILSVEYVKVWTLFGFSLKPNHAHSYIFCLEVLRENNDLCWFSGCCDWNFIVWWWNNLSFVVNVVIHIISLIERLSCFDWCVKSQIYFTTFLSLSIYISAEIMWLNHALMMCRSEVCGAHFIQ